MCYLKNDQKSFPLGFICIKKIFSFFVILGCFTVGIGYTLSNKDQMGLVK